MSKCEINTRRTIKRAYCACPEYLNDVCRVLTHHPLSSHVTFYSRPCDDDHDGDDDAVLLPTGLQVSENYEMYASQGKGVPVQG